MTHVRKATLICDVCGKSLDIDPSVDDPFYSVIIQSESPWRDWLKVQNNHLCEKCAKVYSDKEREMKAELLKLAGIKQY